MIHYSERSTRQCAYFLTQAGWRLYEIRQPLTSCNLQFPPGRQGHHGGYGYHGCHGPGGHDGPGGHGGRGKHGGHHRTGQD